MKKPKAPVEFEKIILDKTRLSDQRVNFIIADNKKVLITENFQIFNEINIDITIGKNCDVQYLVGPEQKPGASKVRHIKVMAGSTFLFNELSCGQSHGSVLEVQLLGEESSTKVYGISFAKQDEKINISHQVYHRAQKTNSQIILSAALGGKAKIKYDANIGIDTGMSHCVGGQTADFLLLSKHAKVETTPNLEIENNDVQCSHAVSIANLDNLKKFYLSSKGINEKDTEKCLVEAHFTKALDNFLPVLKEQAKTLII